jgi:general secretion pathway protein D
MSGCGAGNLWQKPYTSPETPGEPNPFLRARIPEEKPPGEEDKKTDERKKPVVTEAKTATGVKHIATQTPPELPPLVQKGPKDKKDTEKKVHVELAFDNADLFEVLDVTLYDLFGLSYMVDPTLKTTVSFHIAGDYNRDEFINTLNQAFQLNNLSIVRGSGNIYKILPRPSSAGSANAPITLKDEADLVGDVTRLVRLRYVSAATAATNITPFLTKGIQPVQDTVNNALLITDTAENVSRVAAILGVIDIEFFSDLSWQIFPIKEVDTEIIAEDLKNVLQAGGLYKRQGAVEGSFEIFPIKSMSSILVVTRWPSILTLVQDWLAAMDHMTDSDTNVFVYFAENASAMDLADVLQQVFVSQSSSSRSSRSTTGKSSTSKSKSRMSSSSSSSGTGLGGTQSSLGSSQQRSASTTPSSQSRQTIVRPTAAGGGKAGGDDDFSGVVEIIPDEINNAIVFKANNRDYKKVQSILKQLDIQPRQVLINVLIAEIKLSGELNFGIEWFLNKNIGSLGGSTGDYTAQGALDQKTSRAINTPLGTSNGFYLTLYDPAQFMRGLVYALGTDGDVNILSAPNILALDNTEAVIEVGEDVPTITGSTTSAVAGSTVTNTVQYRKTGILLTVTPHINSSGLVKMELVQEVSKKGEYQKELQNYIFLSRRADTSLVVEDKQTIVLAGLMDSEVRNSNSGIPYLKDIPLLGYLFGGVTKSNSKTELVMMITPHVIKNRSQADEITREFSQKVKELQGDLAKK